MAKAKWLTPIRQAYLVKLWTDYGNKCLYGHSVCPIPSHYVYTIPKGVNIAMPTKIACHDSDGNPLIVDGKQVCSTVYAIKTIPSHEYRIARLYELKSEQAIKDWASDDRTQRQAEWQAERKAIHSLGERHYSSHAQFNAIGKDIFYGNQPQYYVDGIGISGLTFKPFAKVRLASSFMSLHVDIGDSLTGMSKNQKRKALRYGKLSDTVRKRVNLAVKHYLEH